MSNVVVTLKIMPESIDINLDKLADKIEEKVHSLFGNVAFKFQKEPVAFGLNALIVNFVIGESESSDDLIEKIKEIEGVNSVNMIDIRRAIG